MSAPSQERLLAALDVTWPAKERALIGDWVVRRDGEGGQRVSSIWPRGEPGMALDDAVDAAAAIQRNWGQTPLFQTGAGAEAVDAVLDARGYDVRSPTLVFTAPAASIAALGLGGRMAAAVRGPLAALDEIWREGGVGPARRAVMDRAPAPKETFLIREEERVAGACFVALDGEIAVFGALHVGERYRRRGLGATGLAAAARFAVENGAACFALMVEAENAPAIALYEKAGMRRVGMYHYRAETRPKPEASP